MKLSNFFIIIAFTIFIAGGNGIFQLIGIRGEYVNDYYGDLPSQISYLTIYILTAFLQILTGRKMFLGLRQNIWFWLLLSWTCMSVIWSVAPVVTIRHAIAVCGTTFFSLYLINNLDIQKYLKLLAISLIIINISCFFIILFFPNLGIVHYQNNAWKGIFIQKNHLGKAASLSILIFSYLVLSKSKGKWIWLLGLFSSGVLLVGSKSVGAMIYSVFIVLVILFLYLAKNFSVLLWVIFLGVFILLIYLPLPGVEQTLYSLGKDETLTGRTSIWEYSINMAFEKPLLGYGYGGFWLGTEGSSSAWIMKTYGWDPGNAHNGYIDLFLHLGAIGFFISFIAFWVTLKDATKFLVERKFAFQYSIYLIFLLWTLAYNFSEEAFLARNNIFWVIFTSALFYLAKEKYFMDKK